MAVAPRGRYVVPNERIPKMIGILNITFATQLLILGLCSSLSFMMMPYAMQAMSGLMKQVEKQVETQKQAQIAKLEADEAAAKTEQEKAAIAAKLTDLKARPAQLPPGMMDFSKMSMMDDPRMRIWSFTDMFSGLIVNGLLLASGIGLLGLRRWAWSMAVWTALVKIVRLALLYGYMAFSIVPDMSKMIGEMVASSMAGQGGPAPPAEMLIRIYTIMYTVGALGFIVFGSIYPIVVIACLTRPSVKAAFHLNVAKKTPVEQALS
jgi:Na+-transporting methylmalonyl-CoA/oxaloacetate decarboxylase gamma subunit